MLEQLYNGLLQDDYISISFEEFQNKFKNDPNYRQKLHAGVVEDGDFSGDYNTFENKFMGKPQGSPEVTQAEEPIVTESGLDVGSLGLPETTEQAVVNLFDINKRINKDHEKVKNKLAEEYFNLDNFKQSRRKVPGGGAINFRGYVRSEEEDLKSWFGEEKYKQYVRYKETGVFDSSKVEGAVLQQAVDRVKKEEAEQYIRRIDNEDLKEDTKKIIQDGIINVFEPEDIDSEGENWLQLYTNALKSDRARDKKIKELGGISIFRVRKQDEEVMKLQAQESEAEKVLAQYFKTKLDDYKIKSSDWNTEHNEFLKINNKYESQLNNIKAELNALGYVDEYSSRDKIIKYNRLLKQGEEIAKKFQSELSEKGIDYNDLTLRAQLLRDGFEKITGNYNKVKDSSTIAKALALDYGLLNNVNLSFETGFAEMGTMLTGTLKGFAWTADKLDGTIDAIINPYGKLSDVDWTGKIDETTGQRVYEDSNEEFMSYWRNLHESVIDYNESLKNYKQTALPLNIDFDDVNMNNIGSWANQALGNNAFSIAAALTYGGAIRAGMNVPKATKVLSGTFFGLESGAKLTHMEIDQRKASEQITKLQESLAFAKTEGEKANILNEIDYYEKALSATELDKAFSSIMYGSIATYAERMGTMRTIRNLNRMSPATDRLTIVNTLKGAGKFGKGVGVEYMEEFLTQVGHNLVDVTVLDQNKSLLAGVDNNFNANVIFSTMAILGPSTSMNAYNTIRSEVITQGEILENRKRRDQIIEINSALQADQESGFKLLDPDQRKTLEMDSKRIMREAALIDSYTMAKVANMTASEIKQLFALNQKKRDSFNKYKNLGASSAYEKSSDGYIKKQKEKILNEIKDLNSQRDKLRDSPSRRRQKTIEATLKNDEIQAETQFFLGKYQGAVNIVKGLAGKVQQFGKVNEDGTIDLTDLEKYLDKAIKSGKLKDVYVKGVLVTAEQQKQEYLKGFREGNPASFLGNDVILVEPNVIREINNAETNLERSIVAYSPIHELQHINDIKTGLVKDNNIVESQKAVVEGIQTEIETLYKQGKIKPEDYRVYQERMDGYTKANNNTVDLMELLTITGELKDAGVLNENSTSSLLSLKLMFNQLSNKYFKKGDMFFKLSTTDDVLRYIDSFQRSTRAQTLVLGPEEQAKEVKLSRSLLSDINKLIPSDVKTKKQYDELLSNPRKNKEIFESITEQGGIINNYIRSKQITKEEGDQIIQNVTDRVLGFNPDAKRADGTKVGIEGFGERIFADTRFGKLDAKKALAIEGKKEGQTLRIDAAKRTKEGETTFDIKDTDVDTETQTIETEDISPAAQARKKDEQAKVEIQKESAFRKAIGIETGSKIYNDILDGARKALLRAYEAGTSARNIQRKLRDEANVYLFKTVKNFLGTKQYISNLKKFREPIMKVMFTSDLVQLERNVPQDERVFTRFVKKLTSKQEVQDAVNQNLLPPDALNTIDKGTAVSLYEKANPTEAQFMSFFDIPAFNPVTKKRSGKRGTRKDQLAKYMAGALSYDATLQVAQEPAVIQRRADLAELNDTQILKDDLQTLASAINRDPNVKFSQKKNKVTYKQKMIKVKSGQVVIDLDQAESVLDDIFNNNDRINFYRNLTDKQADKYGGKFVVEAIIDQYDSRGIERIDNKTIVNFIKKRKRKRDKISNVYEQFFIELADAAVKQNKLGINVNQYVREGGRPDIHFQFEGNSIGLEIKMDSSRGVSYTWKFNDTSTNPNPIDTNATEELINKIKNTAKDNIFSGIDFLKGVKSYNLSTLKTFKHMFNHSVKVTAKYLEYHYTTKKMPEYFINIGDSGLFYMLGQEGDVNNAEVLRIANKLNIPRLQGEFDLISRMDIGKVRTDGTRPTNIRIEPRIDSKSSKNFPEKSDLNLSNKTDMNSFVKELNSSLIRASRNKNSKIFSSAVNFSRSTNKPTQGITVLDFDDTLATTQSLVKFTRPDGTTGTLNAEQYASTYENLLDQGYTFDFSDFNKVVKGKLAPLFNKAMKLQSKFGPENMFVLTARPPAAQKAIFDFLKANGLNIPLKNITGLGNSTAEAKALWIAGKVGEGYNDFYFADDALQNVQAVKNMLDQFDVKSKVQQAKVKFSKSMNSDFNKILEDVTGIDAKKRFSDIKARKRGEKKGKFRLFIPPSHEDFVGLLYNFMGKGKKGDQHRNFFEQALVKPLNRAYREIDTAKQAIANDYKSLNKQFADVKNKLRKKTPDGDFIFEDAVRVYLWNKHGYDIPGLSKTDQQKLVDIVMNDPSLQAYTETLNVISKQEKYVDPGKGWEAGNIQTDLIDATGRVGRAEYFTEFNENADILFSKENLNKIQAAYGADFRSALEDMLHRISTGVNRPKGQHATTNKFMNYLNGSVGTVMFFNVRSAILQQMSIVNYINFADNNIFAAAKAFANQKQYWADFAFIFNSDMLKQRRGGIGTDINGADLAQAVAGSKNPSKMVISYLLKLGFTPTQIGDNIAIATGGATFYRNRVNKYIKDGMSQKEAEAAAFTDFQDLTQSTQQSSRPDMTSQQQASWIGKLVLNFQNITSQYNRIIKKAASDIYNKRISPPYTTRTQSNLGNLSKILYYGGIQNVIFYSLQTALFAVMFDDDKDEDQILKKRERVIQGTIDSILRGSGIYGAIASTLKNTLRKFMEQREKGYNKDESAVLMELLNFSPVVGIKARQIVNAEKTINYNENVISEMETFDADNPQWSAVTNYTQALTNFPANRLYQKSINMRNALDKDYTNFQRVMFFSGYTTWSLGLGDNEAIIEAKEKAKINKKNTKKNKKRSTREEIRIKNLQKSRR